MGKIDMFEILQVCFNSKVITGDQVMKIMEKYDMLFMVNLETHEKHMFFMKDTYEKLFKTEKDPTKLARMVKEMIK